MKVCRGIDLVGTQLFIFRSKNGELLEVDYFFTSLYIFGELRNNNIWGEKNWELLEMLLAKLSLVQTKDYNIT